jgi:hypothetical protein
MPIANATDGNCKINKGDVIEIVVTGGFKDNGSGQYEAYVISKQIYKLSNGSKCLLGEMKTG